MTTTLDQATKIKESTADLLLQLPAEIPDWGKVLIGLVKNSNSMMETLLVEINRLNKLTDIAAVQKSVSTALVKENKLQKKRIDELEIMIDNSEQHGRNRNLLINGVQECRAEEKENCVKKFVDSVNSKSKFKIKHDDIERAHRLGKFQHGRKRPIIARFRDEMKKIKLFSSKKDFKGSDFSLAENLTKHRYNIYQKARDKVGHRNVWTLEGRIFCVHEETKLLIETLTP